MPPGEAGAAAAAAPAAPSAAEIQSLPPPPPAAAAACSPLLSDYDGSVLPLLGRLGGGHQRTLVLLTWIPALFIGFSQFSDSFLLDQPTYWCKGTDGRSNWTDHPPHLSVGGLATSPGANHTYSRGMLAAPQLPTSEAPANTNRCQCSERHYSITAGLQQNVVSKVRKPRRAEDLQRPSPPRQPPLAPGACSDQPACQRRSRRLREAPAVLPLEVRGWVPERLDWAAAVARLRRAANLGLSRGLRASFGPALNSVP